MMFFLRPRLSVLLVCRANICRSPMAELLLRQELARLGLRRRVRIDSAGTHASQPGHALDGRARQVCRRAGIAVRGVRARQVRGEDFARFDYLLAVDSQTQRWLLAACPAAQRARVSLLGDWAAGASSGDIPDPYYGSLAAFRRTLDLLRAPVAGFATHLARRLAGASRKGSLPRGSRAG